MFRRFNARATRAVSAGSAQRNLAYGAEMAGVAAGVASGVVTRNPYMAAVVGLSTIGACELFQRYA
jgi:hypothetical protein